MDRSELAECVQERGQVASLYAHDKRLGHGSSALGHRIKLAQKLILASHNPVVIRGLTLFGQFR